MRSRARRLFVVLFGLSALLSAGRAEAIPVVISSTYSTTPPTIDGTAGAAEWSGTVPFTFTHGDALFRNDGTNLYVLLDVTGDTTADTGSPFDGFYLSFDVNHNGVGDSNVDVEYGQCSAFDDFERDFFVGSCGFTGCRTTSGSLAHGFGASPASGTAHTFWEISIPLSELGVGPGDQLGVAIHVDSVAPSFSEDAPTTECDYAGFATLQLGGNVVTVPTLDRTGLALLSLLLVVAAGLLFRRR